MKCDWIPLVAGGSLRAIVMSETGTGKEEARPVELIGAVGTGSCATVPRGTRMDLKGGSYVTAVSTNAAVDTEHRTEIVSTK